ncbi:uncharacterized protein LOC106072509 [Biomphalaria glabrata]|uniref:Uncharacterized protein LOC106072509 n=1 Tax=Biomphalaria glabrata TaxID=6526 RepID=A0A9W3A617_BIOGL|nr:uncharacterized protein LOC106072509 [Biomphalaria glabrata]XP_055882763.1 uncharacterized protein LOC106072509 [Biomphalaria glabrata]
MTMEIQTLNVAQLQYLVIFISTAISHVSCFCGETIYDRLDSCIESLSFESIGSSNIGSSLLDRNSDLTHLRDKCGNGDFFNAINCMERTIDECKYATTDEAQDVRTMINIERARNTIQYFCTHFKVYERHWQCITGHHEEVTQCAGPSTALFQTQMEATSNKDSQTFQCRLSSSILDCNLKVLRDQCSSEAVDFVQTVMEGFQPSFCASLNTGKSSGTYGLVKDENKAQNIGPSSFLLLFIVIYWTIAT